MKKLFLPLIFTALLCGCASLTGTYSYIPIGPQDLSQTVADSKQMPVYFKVDDVQRPWSRVGVMRVKNLPKDRGVLMAELDKIKAKAAKKGADALLVQQELEENSSTKYPVTIVALLIKYRDQQLPDADQLKLQQFAQQAAMENAN